MISISVNGDEKVIQKLETISPAVRARLLTTVTRLSIGLQGYVVRNKLSGQVLKRRTGTLAASIQWRVEDDSNGIIGIVGSRSNESKPLKYAAIHEYGFQGIVTVREHLRMQTMAWGKAINPRQVTVSEYQMKMNMPVRSFLRSSLKENARNIRIKLNEAVAAGIRDET